MKSNKHQASFGEGITRSQQPADFEHSERYFELLSQWLDMEADAERARLARRRQMRNQRDVERSGETLVRLELIDHHVGLAGRYLLDLGKPGGQALPMHRLKVGTPVVVSDDFDLSDEGIAGVVSRRRANSIQVATERWPEAERIRLDVSPDETTRLRQLSAMAKARTATGRVARLREMLLGERPMRFGEMPELSFHTRLNPPQEEAVRFAMSAKDFAIIHGPPGTGKTTTLAELIFQCVRRGQRVLACAPSNTAVDNILEKLVSLVPHVVRVGHPARVFESLRGHTLDELVDNDPSTAVIQDMRREIDELMRAANRRSRGREGGRRRGELFAEAGRLRGQVRAMERSVIRGILDAADVICTTTTIDEDLLGKENFDLVVIDEACQSTEPSIWQAVLRADRIIFAGDHCQLPPTVLSDEARRLGMQRSLMQRLVERDGPSIYRRLTVQYRMHEAIMRFSSREFYEGELAADVSVRSHRLADLQGVAEQPITDCPLMLIDTAGAEFEEQIEPDGESKLNPQEGQLVVRFVRELAEAGVALEDIGIIAPYAAQVRWLRDRLEDRALEIDTVDGFQGREKEVIVVTMVRSNSEGEIGFLKDTRRTNVALTRAKRKLIVIGDSATLANHPFYGSLFEYFEQENAYHSVWEFTDA